MFVVIVIITLLIAISIHEAAHAWMANELGDPTAKLMGRLSLNPLVHLDPIGTAAFIMTYVLTGYIFGWGKPVIFNPRNLKNPKRDAALISIAGPISNLITASLLSLLFKFTLIPSFGLITTIVKNLIELNIALAVFNFIPIHPLDGGKILVGILPNPLASQVDYFLKRYGLILLLIIILPTFGGVSLVSIFTSPVIEFFRKIFLPSRFLV